MFYDVFHDRSKRRNSLPCGIVSVWLTLIKRLLMRSFSNKEFCIEVMNKMSTQKESGSSRSSGSSGRGRRGDSKRKEEPEPQKNNYVEEGSDDEDIIDLCDDHDYQVLSAVFETDRGRNIAEILSKLQKDVHLLAMSVHQLIQLSLASQSVRRNDDSEDELSESDDGDEGDEVDAGGADE